MTPMQRDALALVLEGYKRGEAGKLCGMDRKTLRDWVLRYNAEGIAGLCNRIAAGPKPRLTPQQEAAVAELVRKGPDLRGRGSLAPGGSCPRDQGAVQCDFGRAQRRRDAAPPRVPALVGAASPSAAGSCGRRRRSLFKLPSYSPELNPVENIWQFLRQNHLGNRVFESYTDIVDA